MTVRKASRVELEVARNGVPVPATPVQLIELSPAVLEDQVATSTTVPRCRSVDEAVVLNIVVLNIESQRSLCVSLLAPVAAT